MRCFALHLARTVEHTVDVDGMLERMEPRQFDEWHQYYQEQPWGDDWQQAGTVAATLHNEILGLVQVIQAMAGGKPEKLKEKDFDQPSDYIPTIQEDAPKKKTKITSTQEMLVMARMMAGV